MPYALVIPIAAERDPRVLERIVLLFILLAGVASVLALADFAATGGNAIDQAGQPENRVLGDAFLLPTLGLVFLLARWLVGARPVVLRRGAVVPLAVLMAAALLVTFQRGAWLALLGGLAVVVILAGRGRRRRRLAGGVLAVIALVSALALVGAAGGSQHGIVHAATDRFASISDEQNVSNKHRLVEWQTAIQGIERHPAWGIGVGSTITFWSPLYSDVTKRMGGTYVTYYLHNSYIWTALKLGVAGLLALLGLIATGVVTAVRTLARSSDVTVRGLLVGAVGAIACFLVLAMTGPHLTIDRSACFLAAVLGLIAALAGTGDRSPGSGLR
jgi:O-antigen ligase